MKPVLLIFTTLIFFSNGCRRASTLSLNTTRQKQIIALQPFDNYPFDKYNELEIDSLAKEIAGFYKKQVIVLQSIDIPANFFNTTYEQYSADSLIMLLSGLQNDSVVEIVGLTHKPIFTIKEDDQMSYYNENIFGMGYQPGNSCIVSDYRFRTTDATIFNRRMRNVIIHEIGHNLGLSHCEDDKCIMSKNNGDTGTLDKSGNDYCHKCRNILKR
jgi:archaemetzincin